MIFLTTQKGVNNSNIAIMQICLILGMFLSELPAGVLGDKFGKKYSVITGLLVLCISSTGFIFFDTFWLLCLLFILEGVGMSFISGSDQSLLYDNFERQGKEEEFLSTMGNSFAISYIALAIGSVVGGGMSKISWNIVYGASSFAIIIAALFFMSIKEIYQKQPVVSDDKEPNQSRQRDSVLREVWEYFTQPEGKKIFIIFIILGVFEGSSLAYFMFSQQFFKQIGVGVFLISVIFMFGRMLSGLSYYFAPKLSTKFPARKLIIISMVGTAVFLSLNIFNLKFYYLVSFLVIAVLPYVSNVLNLNYIHSQIPSETRASIISVSSMVGSFCLGISYLFIGFLLDNTTLNITTASVGLINILVAVFYIKVTKNMEMGTE